VGNHLILGTACLKSSDTLGLDNGARSVKAYSGVFPFGLRLPSPFSLCASTGSHLTRLSELRWRPTILVPSLCNILFVNQYREDRLFCQVVMGCILDCVEKVVRKIYGGKNPKAQN